MIIIIHEKFIGRFAKRSEVNELRSGIIISRRRWWRKMAINYYGILQYRLIKKTGPTIDRTNHNRPDLVFVDKKERTCFIVDIACPFDTRILTTKEDEKLNKCQNMKYENNKL